MARLQAACASQKFRAYETSKMSFIAIERRAIEAPYAAWPGRESVRNIMQPPE